MNFLFSHAIHLDGGINCIYKVYKFKLEPIKYKAELVEGKCPSEILFWRDHDGWKTIRQTKEVRLLAELIGKEINKLKN